MRLLLASEQLHVHGPPEEVGAAVGEERGGVREDIVFIFIVFICLMDVRMVFCRPILLMHMMTNCCHASCHGVRLHFRQRAPRNTRPGIPGMVMGFLGKRRVPTGAGGECKWWLGGCTNRFRAYARLLKPTYPAQWIIPV